MGTTLTALRFAGSQVALVHVGDSRAYLLRGGELSQITHDDTYVQYLVDSGKLTPDEAKDHPRKSVILRALRGAEVEPDVSIREAHGRRPLPAVLGRAVRRRVDRDDGRGAADRRPAGVRRPARRTRAAQRRPRQRHRDRRRRRQRPPRRGRRRRPGARRRVRRPRCRRGLARPTAPPSGRRRCRGRAASRPPPPSRTKRKGRWKTPAIIVGILVLIFAALGGTYAWAQTQYYVGRAGDEVAIYQGVNASFGPIKFSEVYRNTDLKMSDLNPAWRSQVESGITANSKSDAMRIVQRLHDETTPPCPPSTAPSTAVSDSTTGTTRRPRRTSRSTRVDARSAVEAGSGARSRCARRAARRRSAAASAHRAVGAARRASPDPSAPGRGGSPASRGATSSAKLAGELGDAPSPAPRPRRPRRLAAGVADQPVAERLASSSTRVPDRRDPGAEGADPPQHRTADADLRGVDRRGGRGGGRGGPGRQVLHAG